MYDNCKYRMWSIKVHVSEYQWMISNPLTVYALIHIVSSAFIFYLEYALYHSVFHSTSMWETIASSEICKLLFIYVAFNKELWETLIVQGSTTIALVKTLRPIHKKT